MRLVRFFFSVACAVGAAALAPGCGLLGGGETEKVERLCTPGAYVFCRCADRAPGTKLCHDDGQSFAPCTTGAAGECVGGEIEDPRTGEPLPGKTGEPDAGSGGPTTPDACPGRSTAVLPGVEIELEGDTSDAEEDRRGKEGACAVGAGAPDHLYRLIPTGSGSLEVNVLGADGLSPVVYLRAACDDEDSQVACAPPTPDDLVTLRTKVVAGRDYFLFIDGASGSTGAYLATVELTSGPFCGDGNVTSGEACDDGNNVGDDGCSSDCKRVDGDPNSGGSCPGHPVHLWPGQTVTGAGSTTSYGNTWDAPAQTCVASGTNRYQDHIYEVTPHASGSIVVTVTPKAGTTRNFMLTARSTCSDPSTMLACKNDESVSANPETITVPASNGKKLYVAVDGGGLTSNAGEYSITFRLN